MEVLFFFLSLSILKILTVNCYLFQWYEVPFLKLKSKKYMIKCWNCQKNDKEINGDFLECNIFWLSGNCNVKILSYQINTRHFKILKFYPWFVGVLSVRMLLSIVINQNREMKMKYRNVFFSKNLPILVISYWS